MASQKIKLDVHVANQNQNLESGFEILVISYYQMLWK